MRTGHADPLMRGFRVSEGQLYCQVFREPLLLHFLRLYVLALGFLFFFASPCHSIVSSFSIAHEFLLFATPLLFRLSVWSACPRQEDVSQHIYKFHGNPIAFQFICCKSMILLATSISPLLSMTFIPRELVESSGVSK